MGKGKRMLLVFYTLSLAAILLYPVSTVLKIEFPSEAPAEMKFRVRAFDPYDPLRGRYVRLDPLPNEVKVPEDMNFRYREKAFLVLERGRDGFARAVRLTKDRSEIGDGEIFVKVGRVFRKYDKKNKKTAVCRFDLPFRFFYLNELDAPEVERELANLSRPGRDGDFVLTVRFFKDGLFAVKSLEIQKGKK
ncbi:MAG: GDYXXLXY domain-containing protein [Lentisphaeria bacterium]|nr:GDYXXLXY domain-containing protein [Lentisphaeria bacterium]